MHIDWCPCAQLLVALKPCYKHAISTNPTYQLTSPVNESLLGPIKSPSGAHPQNVTASSVIYLFIYLFIIIIIIIFFIFFRINEEI